MKAGEMIIGSAPFASDWATEMAIISSPDGEARAVIRQRRNDGTEGRGIVLTLRELKNLVAAYFEWDEEGGCLGKVPVKGGSGLPKLNILQKIAVLGKTEDEWSREFNIVSFNERAPRFDIREWLPDHKKSRNGKMLSEREMEMIAGAYEQHFGPLPHRKEHWWE